MRRLGADDHRRVQPANIRDLRRGCASTRAWWAACLRQQRSQQRRASTAAQGRSGALPWLPSSPPYQRRLLSLQPDDVATLVARAHHTLSATESRRERPPHTAEQQQQQQQYTPERLICPTAKLHLRHLLRAGLTSSRANGSSGSTARQTRTASRMRTTW